MVFLGEISVIGMKKRSWTHVCALNGLVGLLKGLKQQNTKAVDAHERKED